MLFEEIKGCEYAKRAAEVALAGKHSLFLYGPSGSEMEKIAGAVLDFDKTIPVYYAYTCQCGGYLHTSQECLCSAEDLIAHQKRLLQSAKPCEIKVFCPNLTPKQILGPTDGEKTEEIRKRVERARAKLNKEECKNTNVSSNRKDLSDKCEKLLQDMQKNRIGDLLQYAVLQLGLTLDDVYTIIRVTLTIQDLSDEIEIRPEHLSEALQYSRVNLKPD